MLISRMQQNQVDFDGYGGQQQDLMPTIKGTRVRWLYKGTQRHHQENKVDTLSIILNQ